MKKRYIIPFVLVVVLMSVAMASADGYGCYYGQNCYPYYGYTVPVYTQPVVRECASFVADVTIADGTYVAPGTTFTKTWRIRNCGTTTWNTNYKLVFSSGTQMTNLSSVKLPYTVMPGQTVDISIQMTAPQGSGSYKSSWMLMNDKGSQFGVGNNCMTPVWAQISTYVQTPTYNYGYNWCYGYNNCYGYNYNYYCDPCYWDCRAPGFDRDPDANFVPGVRPPVKPAPPKPPKPWCW